MSHLFTRYSQRQIYTSIGDILLAVNPFTPLAVFNDKTIHTFCYFVMREKLFCLFAGGHCVTVFHKIFTRTNLHLHRRYIVGVQPIHTSGCL